MAGRRDLASVDLLQPTNNIKIFFEQDLEDNLWHMEHVVKVSGKNFAWLTLLSSKTPLGWLATAGSTGIRLHV